MITSEDMRIDDVGDFVKFIPIVIFIGLVAPFLLGAYAMGFILNIVGLLD